MTLSDAVLTAGDKYKLPQPKTANCQTSRSQLSLSDSGTPLRSVPDLPTPEEVFGAHLPDPQAVPPVNALDSSVVSVAGAIII